MVSWATRGDSAHSFMRDNIVYNSNNIKEAVLRTIGHNSKAREIARMGGEMVSSISTISGIQLRDNMLWDKVSCMLSMTSSGMYSSFII